MQERCEIFIVRFELDVVSVLYLEVCLFLMFIKFGISDFHFVSAFLTFIQKKRVSGISRGI